MSEGHQSNDLAVLDDQRHLLSFILALIDRDDDSGKFTEPYPLPELVDALKVLGWSAGTQEVADAVGCKYHKALMKPSQLEEQKTVDQPQIGKA